VITTGQQPGLFGGATMTLAKALTARAFADALEAHIGIPVAPVFWAATDDADFEEAAVVSIAGNAGAEILRHERSAPPGTPMADVPLGSDVEGLAHRLREACGSVADSRALDAVLEAYRPGATVGGAYVAFLRELLSPLGIGVIDASHPAVRGAASPLLRRAVTRAETVAAAVHARTAEIVDAGFSPQVEEVPGLSLLFTYGENGKRRLSLPETSDARVAAETLSSTVLLRPIMERSILPSAFYVGGPGEIAYFAQVSAVAEALGSPVPLVQPRWSVAIVEPRVRGHLDSLGVDRTALRDPAALEGQVARRRMPRDVGGTLERLRDDIRRDIEAMRTANAGLVADPVIDGLERSLSHRLERMERRLLAAVKRRESASMQLIAALRGALYPHGAPQERKLSYIPFLSRYGSSLIDEMLSQAGAHARSRIIEVPSTPTSQAAAASARA
jgi:bacillithiol biosynthesis cysteine-adding enzyme BshC